jgi:diguanylate cyclase (GGDEF)-like protein
MFIADILIGSNNIGYYDVGISLSLLVPMIATPIISYKFISLTNKLEQTNRKLSYHTQYDELTNIYNQRHTLELANYEFAISKRTKSPISALFIEYNNFKEIKKKYGSTIGDIILTELIRSLNNTIRTTDIFGRYQDAKFLLICPMLDLESAQKLSNEIKKEVEQVIHINDYNIKLSINIGCAEMHNYGNSTLKTLLNKADIALEEAKNSQQHNKDIN